MLPSGDDYAEALRTRRADVGGLARWVLPDTGVLGALGALHGAIVTVRGSGVEQRHGHRFGGAREHDAHGTWFGEAALAVPRGRTTYIGGAAYQRDRYRNADVDGFDYTFATPALFVQTDVDPTSWLALSASARLDAHSAYGTSINPRVSLLLRRPADRVLAGWTTRASGGTGAFAPTPFTEETEATGLTPLAPLRKLVAERARSASLDVGGPFATTLGRLELNATAFGSRISRPLQVVDAPGVTTDGARRPRTGERARTDAHVGRRVACAPRAPARRGDAGRRGAHRRCASPVRTPTCAPRSATRRRRRARSTRRAAAARCR